MELVLLKDWGSHKKGSKVNITDESVIKKGFEVKLFEEQKKQPKKDK